MIERKQLWWKWPLIVLHFAIPAYLLLTADMPTEGKIACLVLAAISLPLVGMPYWRSRMKQNREKGGSV